MPKKLIRAEIPMCPICALEIAGHSIPGEYWCNHCEEVIAYHDAVMGYFAPDIDSVVEEMEDEYRAQTERGSRLVGSTLGTLVSWITRLKGKK